MSQGGPVDCRVIDSKAPQATVSDMWIYQQLRKLASLRCDPRRGLRFEGSLVKRSEDRLGQRDLSLRKIIAEQLAATFSENSSSPRQTQRLRYGRWKAIAPSYGGRCGEKDRKFPRTLLPRLLLRRQTPRSCSQHLAPTTPLPGLAPESFGWKRNPGPGRARPLKTIKDWGGPRKHGFRTKSGALECRRPLWPLATESKSQLILSGRLELPAQTLISPAGRKSG
jgi:hypothetical protein